MSGYVLHPEVYTDLDGICEFSAEDNEEKLDAADRVRDEIHETVCKLVPFLHQGQPGATPHRLSGVLLRPMKRVGGHSAPSHP